jgi:Tol biopolymer transport system component
MGCIVEIASGRTWHPKAPCHAMNYAWSPMGDAVAFEGPGYSGTRRMLCVMEWPSMAVKVLDSLSVSTDFHFSWSSDSRWLVLDHATQLDNDEEVVASDLWLISRDGKRCQLTRTRDLIETEPHWVNESRIQFMLSRPSSEGSEDDRRFLEVRFAN